MSPSTRSPESIAIAALPAEIDRAVKAAEDKKALDVVVMDLREVAAFTDYFVICTGQSSRQVKAIADNVEEALRKTHVRPAHIEGYEHADWVLLDYFDFIVHIFSQETRRFYALDRLWGSARRIAPAENDSREGGRSA